MRYLSASMAIFKAASQKVSVSMSGQLKLADAASTGRALRLHMLGTATFIFVAFLLRSVFSTMYAVAFQLRDFGKHSCPGANSRCDSSCYNVYTHIADWMNNTPEFHLMVVLISSPVAQLVALWGMTSKSTLQLMKSSKRDKALNLASQQPKEEEDSI